MQESNDAQVNKGAQKNEAPGLDAPSEIREGEELDRASLDAFLRSKIEGLEGALSIRQFPGGASNLTYLLRYDNEEFVLRRPPFGKIAKSAHDMLREAKVIDAVRPFYPCAPKIIASSDDHSIIGCDFFIMQRIRGVIPRRDLPAVWDLSEAQVRAFCISGLDRLIELHAIDTQQGELAQLGKGTGYVERQIQGWSERWQRASTPDAASFQKVMCWLDDNKPEDLGNCLIHNDFRFDNLVYAADNPQQVIGVLDWEMATLGDPLMDLGNSLAYWIQADDPAAMLKLRLQPTHLPGMLSREEAVTYYLEQSGLRVENFSFYEVYGLFRLAVIVQQIYYRFFHGQTKDKRFAGFAQFAALLEQRCLQLIARLE